MSLPTTRLLVGHILDRLREIPDEILLGVAIY